MFKKALIVVGVAGAIIGLWWLMERRKGEKASFAEFAKKTFNLDVDPISGKTTTPATAGAGTNDFNTADYH